jgi:T5SS/PEP-CTERM-associated repeat protein
MARPPVHLRILFALSALCVSACAARTCADTIAAGDVTPSDPSTWTTLATVRIAQTQNGSVIVDSDSDVVSQYAFIGYTSGFTGAFTVDGGGSTWTDGARITVGYGGNGTLNVTGGAVVSDDIGYLGYIAQSTGFAAIDGKDSKWTNSSQLYVGFWGNGRLQITGGGSLSDTFCYIGYDTYDLPPSIGTGLVTVDGHNSKWTNSSSLNVGRYGVGTLNVSGSAAVTATSVSINSQSLLAIDTGNGSALTVNGGSGMVTNNGIVRILAGANAAAGVPYTPIAATAGTWGGSGTYQPIGGTWDSTGHTFTASAATSGTADNEVTINLKDIQRILIDSSLGASFAPTTSDTWLNLTASAVSGQPLLDLESILSAHTQTLLSDWQIAVTSGYTTGQPAYLSFNIGSGVARNDITVWHYDGAAWTKFDATDLTCSGGYASFTVYGFSAYALSVPEPGAIALLASGLLAMIAYIRRRSP